jgi:Flp pilus assembly protein TadG
MFAIASRASRAPGAVKTAWERVSANCKSSLVTRTPAWRGVSQDGGAAAIEFAFIAPVFFLLVLGCAQFSVALSNYLALSGAVHIGARQLAISRGDATPMTDTKTAIVDAAGALTQGNITVNYSVNGITCTTDASCGAGLAAGVPVRIGATYPCSVVIMGTNFIPNCSLSVATTERAQ